MTRQAQLRPSRLAAATLAALMLAASPLTVAGQAPPQGLQIPGDARELEGRPEVRVETTKEGASRRVLDAREADANRLKIRVADGSLYWGDESRPLAVTSTGDYIYLSSSAEPGRYVRLRRLNDRFTYVEHIDQGPRSITYWGELRVVLGR